VRKESEKAAVVKKNSVVSKSKVAAVVSEKSSLMRVLLSLLGSRLFSRIGMLRVSKFSDESVKESVKVPVVKKSVKASSVVTDKPSSENQNKIDVVVKKSVKSSSVVADKRSSVVADKVDVVVKKRVKASSVVTDKPSCVVTDKKLKIKAGLKRMRSGSDSSNSLEIDTKSIKRPISKLEKKVKKQESDEDSVPKKGKKKLTKKVDKELSDEESLPKKGNKKLTKKVKKEESDEDSDKIEVTPSKIHDMLGVPFEGYSLFNLDEREANHEFVRKWAGQLSPLELKKVRVNDIARKLIAAQEIDFLFKLNFLTLFTNTMGKADGLKGQICLDDVRRLREDSVISDIDWCRYIYDCLRDSKLPGGTNHYLGPLTFLINGDDDGGNVDNDANDCDGNGDEEDVNEGDKDPNGSNPSFGFSKISLEDFGNDSGPAEIDKAVEGNPTEQGTVIEGNEAEKGEIMSTPKNFTQWLEKNVDLVGE
nr:hypothetical protein [Tanacetum cinerariifolium]